MRWLLLLVLFHHHHKQVAKDPLVTPYGDCIMLGPTFMFPGPDGAAGMSDASCMAAFQDWRAQPQPLFLQVQI